MVKVSSWGRLGSWEHDVSLLADVNGIAQQIKAGHQGVVYGMGRSYGDVCLNPGGTLWKTTGLNHFISFNPDTGRLVCEAGVQLKDIQETFMPRGWALSVTPGTQFVTVGGAVANDVHGKNHHVIGSFGDTVHEIKLIRTDGAVIECAPEKNQNWFRATVGGLGLTGVMAAVDIQLRRVNSQWVDSEVIPFRGLDAFFELADGSEKSWEYTVSWIDSISGKNLKGLFIRGNHADSDPGKKWQSRRLSMPFEPAFSLVNKLTLKPFNAFYYGLNAAKKEKRTVHYQSFFYPLDNISHWNRMYGPKGFYQHQCVVPRENGKQVLQEMLEIIRRSGQGSFLSVLKTFGNRMPLGLMSFPMPGITLAMDFPNKGEKTISLLKQLDEVVYQANGRIYLAKDARMSPEVFQSGYPSREEFLQFHDPGISSALSRRLMGV